jgi:hypothetical protein
MRLTLGGQINLKKRYPQAATGQDGSQTALNVIFASMDEPELMSGIFTEALNYGGNENAIKDGVELYDLLVDNGYSGSERFVPILTSIACVSGLLSEGKKKAVDAMAERALTDEEEKAMAALENFEKNA